MYKRCVLVVFLLLCTGGALAADQSKSEASEKARAAALLLKNIGLSAQDARETAEFVDDRLNNGYLELAKGDVEGMYLNLRYDADSVDMENLELQMKFEESDPYDVTASSNGVMFRFKLVW